MSALLRSFIVALSLCLLAACGGGSSGYSSAAPSTGGGTVDATGVWSGSFTVGAGAGSTAIVAVIKQGGTAFFYDQSGVMYVLPQFTGGTTVTGTLTAFAPPGVILTNGQSTETFTVTASVSSVAITGTFTGDKETGTFTLAPLSAFGTNPTVVAGNWQGFYVGSASGSTAAVALTVQVSGSFVGNDANGCHLSGTISPTADHDVFSAAVTSTGGASCAGMLTGLAFESRQDLSGFFGGTTGTYYYVGVSNPAGAFVAELKVQ